MCIRDRLFAKLTAEIHRRGMKIILDGVFNHCGSFNKWMEDVYKRQDFGRGILERVLGYSDYHARDDMTVLVAGVWKK